MLKYNLNSEWSKEPGIQALEQRIPTVLGLANLCGWAIEQFDRQPPTLDQLSPEAKSLLHLATGKGIIELRGDKNAFDPIERLLAVCVPVDEEKRIVFRDKSSPRQTVAFMDGFRQLCGFGLVIHQLMFDFSLTSSGFALADQIDGPDFESTIQFGYEEPI